MIHPFKLAPAFKDYVWGGYKLAAEYNKPDGLIAESWELSGHKDGDCVIKDGPFQGMAFSQFCKENPALTGANAAAFDRFPILIKLIDSREDLSVQVHPDDAFALENEEDYGKTEVWFVLQADPGAFVYHGFNQNITKEQFVHGISDGSITDLLKTHRVKKGDVIFIDPGTVHAIGAGIVLAEVQQNSNLTYRVYDYGRNRPLHIEKGLAVLDLGPAKTPVFNLDSPGQIADCRYFKARFIGQGEIKCDETSFVHLLVTNGSGRIDGVGFSQGLDKGDSLFIPVQRAVYNLTGDLECVETRV